MGLFEGHQFCHPGCLYFASIRLIVFQFGRAKWILMAGMIIFCSWMLSVGWVRVLEGCLGQGRHFGS